MNTCVPNGIFVLFQPLRKAKKTPPRYPSLLSLLSLFSQLWEATINSANLVVPGCEDGIARVFKKGPPVILPPTQELSDVGGDVGGWFLRCESQKWSGGFEFGCIIVSWFFLIQIPHVSVG